MKFTLLTRVVVFFVCSLLTIEGISFNFCTRWNSTGITIAGSDLTQLNRPQAIFIDDQSKFLYVADSGNKRIQRFSIDPWIPMGETVLSNIQSISGLYADSDDMSIYLSLRYENRVEKWSINDTVIEQIGDQCKQCAAVWLDQQKNVYMSESGRHRILRWSPQDRMTTIVAGRTDEQGQRDDELYFPRGIFYHEQTRNLYIADTNNNRIQRWIIDQLNGSTVAGSNNGSPGFDQSTLANPSSVWVDEQTDIIYVVDTENDRIQRWLPNESTGTTIVGGNGRGNENSQLSSPNSMAFDSFGNLYVSDSNNHRIQLFMLMDNETCSSTTTTPPSSTSIASIKFVHLHFLVVLNSFMLSTFLF